jgi:YhcH/YjgK/YiaL family protein
MIIDTLTNANSYTLLHYRIEKAFEWLHSTELNNLTVGKYLIEEENVFAIVQEYKTLDAANEQMEAHKKYIDVQYMIKGEEMVGLSLLNNQTISKEYDYETDFLLVSDAPSFFATLSEGNFMIFFPTDLHMPCIKINEPALVKKVVVKVCI